MSTTEHPFRIFLIKVQVNKILSLPEYCLKWILRVNVLPGNRTNNSHCLCLLVVSGLLMLFHRQDSGTSNRMWLIEHFLLFFIWMHNFYNTIFNRNMEFVYGMLSIWTRKGEFSIVEVFQRLQLTIFIIKSRGSLSSFCDKAFFGPLAPFFRSLLSFSALSSLLSSHLSQRARIYRGGASSANFLNCLGLWKNVNLQSTDRYINKDYHLACHSVNFVETEKKTSKSYEDTLRNLEAERNEAPELFISGDSLCSKPKP